MAKVKKKAKKNNLKLGVLLNVIILFGGIIFLVFNNHGILKYYNLHTRLNKVNSDVKQADSKISNLRDEIDSLKSNMTTIEKIARERYYMKRENEIVLDVEEYTE